MARNFALGLVGVLFLAVSLLFLWFTVLGSVTHSTPLDKTYFLRADTSGITGARDVTEWYFFRFCGQGSNDCGPFMAAPAFGKAWASGAQDVPSDLEGSHGGHTTSFTFYYMWRFGWVFFIIALFFNTIAFFSAFLACLGRLGAAIASAIAFFSLIILTIAAALMTATFSRAQSHFSDAGRSARIGRYAFGFVWASWACLFLATILLCLGIRNRDKTTTSNSTGGRFGGFGGRFRRGRSVRSNGSYGGRRVKDDYA